MRMSAHPLSPETGRLTSNFWFLTSDCFRREQRGEPFGGDAAGQQPFALVAE
jgi:hypothetical protein